MQKNILKTIKLSKSYEMTQILTGIDFDMKQGDYTAVMGPSGAGKSTFLHLISGMDRPTSGKVYIDKNEIGSMNDKRIADLRLSRIGMVFQQPALLPTLNLIDNVMLPAFMLKRDKHEDIKTRANSLLSQFGILDKKDMPVNTLSGGQLQRGCIARALINNPLILFADEPTGALNSSATNSVLDVLETVNKKGTAILIVTHDIKVASRAKQVVYLHDGVIKDQIIFLPEDCQSNREKRIMDWQLLKEPANKKSSAF